MTGSKGKFLEKAGRLERVCGWTDGWMDERNTSYKGR